MLSSSIPSKIQLPFAANAGGGFIRTIPVPSQIGIVNGEASWSDGFPPLTFSPDSAGGINPDGRDMNGILNAVSSLLWWYSAGAPISYDSTFQTAIGGYPQGAIVQSAVTSGVFWLSTADNNVTNPDAGGAGWTNAYSPPAGVVLPFAGGTIPTGYLAVPTGATLVSTTAYANLYNAIGYAWGGSGASFGLPYLASGYVPVQGSVGALTHGALLAHTHLYDKPYYSPSAAGGGGNAVQNLYPNVATGSTGGSDNLAAGRGHQFIVKF